MREKCITKKKRISGRENYLIEETNDAQNVQVSHVRSTRCVLVLRNKIFERIFLTLFLKKFFSVLYLYVFFALSNIPVFQHRTIRKWSIKGLCN